MSDGAPSAGSRDPQPTVEQAALTPEAVAAQLPPVSSNGTSPSAAAQGTRPELVVGAAFAGGLALALLLRRLGR